MLRIKKSYWILMMIMAVCAWLVYEADREMLAVHANENKESFEPAYIAIAKGFVDVEGGIIHLAAQRDGVIESVLVEEGDYVKEGQKLATLITKEAELQRDRAQAELNEIVLSIKPLKIQLKAAQREIIRYSPLVKDQAAPKQQLDQFKDEANVLRAEIAKQEAAMVTAKARLAEAEYEIELRTIRAPQDGRIVKRLARPGVGLSTLNVSTLFWFAPETPRIIRAELEERFVEEVFSGMNAFVIPESDESKSFRASIKRKGLFFGPKRPSSYDPEERADVRVVEIVLELIEDTPLLLGQRVIVKFGEVRRG